MMSQSHGIKGRSTNEAFQEQCFLWERGASVGLLNFKDLLQVESLYSYGCIGRHVLFCQK